MKKAIAIWYGDDLAYTESTIVSPEVYRKRLFPWMEEMASIAHGAGMPFIFHSDGRLWDVIPDLIALGLNGLHPIEPKAMDINEVKAKYGHELALIGNIDMDLLARGTPQNKPLEQRPLKEWEFTIDVNMKGVFLCAKHVVAKAMKPARQGVIINMGSLAGMLGKDHRIYRDTPMRDGRHRTPETRCDEVMKAGRYPLYPL